VADALRRFSPGVALVERGDAFRDAAAALGAQGGDAAFLEVRLPPSGADATPPEKGNVRRLWNEIRR
jgi:hypothetical protein